MNIIVYTIIPSRNFMEQKTLIENIIVDASLGRTSRLDYKQVNLDNTVEQEFSDFSQLPVFDGVSEYVEYYENILDIPYGININQRNGFINAFGGSEIFIALNLNKLYAKMKSNELLSAMSHNERTRSGSKKSPKKHKESKKKKFSTFL